MRRVPVAAGKNIRNAALNSSGNENKITGPPFTSDNSSAYYKFTYTTDEVVTKSLGFFIGCNSNEQF
jgi:hypothetical protein